MQWESVSTIISVALQIQISAETALFWNSGALVGAMPQHKEFSYQETQCRGWEKISSENINLGVVRLRSQSNNM